MAVLRLAHKYAPRRLEAACARALPLRRSRLRHDQADPGRGPGSARPCRCSTPPTGPAAAPQFARPWTDFFGEAGGGACRLNHQLTPKLKSLRLSGILETLEVRTQQAITEQLSYGDFLQRLIEDEVERRGQKQLALRLRRATLDPTKTLESFDFGFNPTLNRQQIFDLGDVSLRRAARKPADSGPGGCRASRIWRRPWPTRRVDGASTCSFIPAARMLAHLHGGRADGTYERRLLTYTRPDLLVLDDFGLKPLAPPAPEDFYDVINERYERGAMIVTSNRAFSEWPDLFQSPLLASAALDRLAHHAQQITITGESFRTKGRRRAPREGERGPAAR